MTSMYGIHIYLHLPCKAAKCIGKYTIHAWMVSIFHIYIYTHIFVFFSQPFATFQRNESLRWLEYENSLKINIFRFAHHSQSPESEYSWRCPSWVAMPSMPLAELHAVQNTRKSHLDFLCFKRERLMCCYPTGPWSHFETWEGRITFSMPQANNIFMIHGCYVNSHWKILHVSCRHWI